MDDVPLELLQIPNQRRRQFQILQVIESTNANHEEGRLAGAAPTSPGVDYSLTIREVHVQLLVQSANHRRQDPLVEQYFRRRSAWRWPESMDHRSKR
jgi:hypothetical protein